MATTNSTIWAPKGEQGDPGPVGPPGPQGPVGPVGGPGPDAAAFVAYTQQLALGTPKSNLGYNLDVEGSVLQTIHDKLAEEVSPADFGIVMDGVTDNILKLEAFAAYSRSRGNVVLNLGRDALAVIAISRPWKCPTNQVIIGMGMFVPTPDFSSDVTFTIYGTATTEVYDCLIYVNEGEFSNDPNNFGYAGLTLGKHVTLNGKYQVSKGLIVEGVTNWYIGAKVYGFAIGVDMKYYCWGGKADWYISNCTYAFYRLGPASNGIDLSGVQCFGQTNTPTWAVIIEGDNNGVSLSGGFYEKFINGLLFVTGSGPGIISGIDFEICSGVLVKVDGTGIAGRAVGPINLIGNFKEAATNVVWAINAIVNVSGGRIRNTALAFRAEGGQSRINYENCVIESSVTQVSSGPVCGDIIGTLSRTVRNTLPQSETSYIPTYAIENCAYYFNESLVTSGINFESSLQDPGALQRFLSKSTWKTCEMRSGSVFGTLGLVLNFTTGSKDVEPFEDATHNLGGNGLGGKPVKRFDKIFSRAIVQCAGVGATVNPAAIGEMVMQFTSNGQVTIKAMGSDGVIRVGNITLA